MKPLLFALNLIVAQNATPATPPPTPVESTNYESNLLQLSEMMGALSYLRDLCQFGDSLRFRDSFGALIEANPGTQEQKDKLAGEFNRGYDGYKTIYKTCTTNARIIIADFLSRSQRLARDVASRYGPS